MDAAPPSSSELDAHRDEGVRLFNEGHYWHAHEQWEICWLRSSRRDALFYKGIIQAAAALVHWQKGNLRGLRRNWEKARPKIVAMPPTLHGIDLASLVREMDRFVVAAGAATPPRLVNGADSDPGVAEERVAGGR